MDNELKALCEALDRVYFNFSNPTQYKITYAEKTADGEWTLKVVRSEKAEEPKEADDVE